MTSNYGGVNSKIAPKKKSTGRKNYSRCEGTKHRALDKEITRDVAPYLSSISYTKDPKEITSHRLPTSNHDKDIPETIIIKQVNEPIRLTTAREIKKTIANYTMFKECIFDKDIVRNIVLKQDKIKE